MLLLSTIAKIGQYMGLIVAVLCLLYIIQMCIRYFNNDDRLPIVNISVAEIDTWITSKSFCQNETSSFFFTFKKRSRMAITEMFLSLCALVMAKKKIQKPMITSEMVCEKLNSESLRSIQDTLSAFDSFFIEQGFKRILLGRNIISISNQTITEKLEYRYHDKNLVMSGKLGKLLNGQWKILV